MYRGEYYGLEQDWEGNPTKDIAEVIVAKNRFGPVGTVRMRFINRFARFENLDEFAGANQYSEVDMENRIKQKYKIFKKIDDDPPF